MAGKTYDGCTGSLQRNESDMPLMPIMVPVDAQNVENVAVSHVRRYLLGSAYKVVQLEDKLETNVMDFPRSFSISLWLLIATTMMVFAMLFSTRRRIHKWNTGEDAELLGAGNIIRILLGKSLKRMDSFTTPDHVRIVRFLSFLLTVFSFLILFYLTSMIKTDAVTYKKPLVIDDYYDLVASGRRPIWFKSGPDLIHFRSAPDGSTERRLLLHAQRMGMDESLIVPDQAGTRRLLQGILSFEYVLVATEMSIDSRFTMLCIMESTCRTSYASTWRKYVPDVRELVVGFIVNHLMPKKTLNHLRSNINRMFQQQIDLHEMDRAPLLKYSMTKPSFVYQCLSNQIEYPDIDLHTLNHYHYRYLFLIMILVPMLAAVVFLIEMMDKKWLAAVSLLWKKGSCPHPARPVKRRARPRQFALTM